MNLKKILLDNFGVDLPISGGLGNSIDSPIIIEKAGMNDYVGTEYAVLKYIGILRGVEWKMLQQNYLIHNNREIDKIKIETIKTTEKETITKIESYYFDFTECLEITEKESTFDEEQTIQKTTDRIEELRHKNELSSLLLKTAKINYHV